jgi:hypothetical protein
MCGDQSFEVDIVVGAVVVVVVVAGLAIALAIPCWAGHCTGYSLCSPSDGLVKRESKIL